MTYRSDLDALEARKAALDAEVVEKARERDEAARMLDEARVLASAEDRFERVTKRRRSPVSIAALVVVAVMLGIGGIAIIKTRTKPDTIEQAIVQMERFTDDMCQCRDRACAEGVSDAMMTWSEAISKHQPDLRPNEIQMKRFTQIGERMAGCMTRTMNPPVETKPD